MECLVLTDKWLFAFVWPCANKERKESSRKRIGFMLTKSYRCVWLSKVNGNVKNEQIFSLKSTKRKRSLTFIVRMITLIIRMTFFHFLVLLNVCCLYCCRNLTNWLFIPRPARGIPSRWKATAQVSGRAKSRRSIASFTLSTTTPSLCSFSRLMVIIMTNGCRKGKFLIFNF